MNDDQAMVLKTGSLKVRAKLGDTGRCRMPDCSLGFELLLHWGLRGERMVFEPKHWILAPSSIQSPGAEFHCAWRPFDDETLTDAIHLTSEDVRRQIRLDRSGTAAFSVPAQPTNGRVILAREALRAIVALADGFPPVERVIGMTFARTESFQAFVDSANAWLESRTVARPSLSRRSMADFCRQWNKA